MSDSEVGATPCDDLDLLEALLEASDTNEEKESSDTLAIQSKEELRKQSDDKKLVANIHSGDTDSSDDEDNRYFESQKYNECGRNIKKIINSNENTGKLSLFLGDPKSKKKEITWKTKVHSGPTKSCTVQQKLDVYSDPVFGIRMINPLITSRQLQEKMVGRTAVTLASIKRHIANGGTESDWVIAGVVVEKSPIRTSQKGSQYCIWKISDLKVNLKTISVFFFRNSHQNLWKTAIGTVIGILNPRVMEDSKNGDEATIAVDNAQKIMILGVSKDYGLCKAKKKNGEDCTSFVNTNICSYCIYHVQQEYKKCSRRSELQAPCLRGGHVALRNKVLGKNEVFYGGQSFMAVPTTENRKHVAKDRRKLQTLIQSTLPASGFISRLEANQQSTIPASGFINKLGANKQCFKAGNQQTKSQQLKDKEILSTLQSKRTSEKPDKQITTLKDGASRLNSQPQLSKAAEIDLSKPVNKFLVNRAKFTALEWVKRNGKLSKSNPNEVRKKNSLKRPHNSINDNISSAEDRVSKIRKILISNEEAATAVPEEISKPVFSSKFMELFAAKSKHTDLVEASDSNAQDEYFNLLEKKEKLEEKMLTTFKVPCKAVHCLKCKYTAFSASELCKTERHPLKVTDAVKRFFRCKDCNNRTSTLELIPLLTCTQCGGSHWERAPMMKERKGSNLEIQPLSIRGGEEKFLSSLQTNGNLNLLVPE